MNIWDILGIEYTEDINIIKKAYAKKLKIYHPENDAQGYQRLREAYDQAIKISKAISKSRINTVNEKKPDLSENSNVNQGDTFKYSPVNLIPDSSNFSDVNQENAFNYVPVKLIPDSSNFKDVNQEDTFNYVPVTFTLDSSNYNNVNTEKNDIVIPPNINLNEKSVITVEPFENRLKSFMEQLENIYINFSKRISVDAWIDILNQDIMWEIENKRALFNKIIDFLLSHRNLPKEIWRLIDDSFQLQDQLEGYASREIQSFREFLLKVLNQRAMTFQFLNGIDYKEREKFIECRINALEDIRNMNSYSAWYYIRIAKQIFDGDPELACLEGICLVDSHEIDEAIKAFSKALELETDFEEALSGRADAYLCKGDFASAKSDFKALFELRPNDNKVVAKLAKIYLKLNDPYGARYLYKKVNAYELTPEEIQVSDLIATNKALIKISKKTTKNDYLQKELPIIKSELKKLKKCERLRFKSKSVNIYKTYFKFAAGLALLLVSLAVLNIFYKAYGHEDTKQKSNTIVQEQNSSPDLNGPILMIPENLSSLDLEKLSNTGRRISVILNNPVVFNFFIDDTNKISPTIGNMAVHDEEFTALDMLNKLFIGRNGDKSLIFSGNILNLIDIKFKERANYFELPSKVTVEGVIVKCDIADLKSQVSDALSDSIYWKSSDIEAIDTNYILKMDDHPRIVKTKSASSINTSNIIGKIIGVLLLSLILGGMRYSKR